MSPTAGATPSIELVPGVVVLFLTKILLYGPRVVPDDR
jgi:hypothetical protein